MDQGDHYGHGQDTDQGTDGMMMMDDEANAFCQGSGFVMLNGFQLSFNSQCILWLFKDAVVDTSGKYAAAIIGTYLLAVAFEIIRFGRVRFAKGQYPFESFKEKPNDDVGRLLRIDALNAFSYMVQVMIAYWIMLLVMLYEAMIFISIILGLGTGYLLVLRMTRRLNKSSEELAADGDRADDTDSEPDIPPVKTKDEASGSEDGIDDSHKIQTPCCANA
jgi:Ctr copper transporter family